MSSTMTHHNGDLTVTSDNLDYARTLTSVVGYLDICAENAGLGALTSVGGDLAIRKANAGLGALTSVGGYLYINAENAGLTALTSVGGYPFAWPDQDVARARLVAVAKHALATDDALDMSVWHTCDTTHCVAGWAQHLEGPAGYEMARRYGDAGAGAALLGQDAAAKFFLNTNEARAWLQGVLEQAGAA
jgi:hypothetical protein